VGKPGLLKQLNASVLLDAIRDEGPLSRPDLARLTGLSLPTVNVRVRRLVQAGYVREAGRTESRGGRRARLLEFNGKFGYVAGIDVGGHQVSAAVADLSGEVVSFERRPLGERVSGERILKGAWEVLCRELEERGIGVGDLMAIGVSTPGIVDPESGSVTCVPNIPGWSELRPDEQFGELIGKTVVVENNVNAAMEGEHWRGAARGARDAIFVAVGTGVGAGILIGGRLFRGWKGAAGEIGLQREFHDDEPLDAMFGPFERRASGIGIAERYRELAGEKRATARTIFEAAASGDELARRVVEEATSLLAGGLVNMCAVLAPELVVLGGGVARAGEALVGPIRERLERSLPAPPRCVLSELGDQASVVGAVRLALGAAYREEFSFGLKRDYQGRSVRA
jgi:predicted NBD/HSP70 family sugar kinase